MARRTQCFVSFDDFITHWQQAALQAVQPKVIPMRRQRDESCSYCQRYQPGEMYPPHDASPRCESGKRNHCTCDTCF